MSCFSSSSLAMSPMMPLGHLARLRGDGWLARHQAGASIRAIARDAGETPRIVLEGIAKARRLAAKRAGVKTSGKVRDSRDSALS